MFLSQKALKDLKIVNKDFPECRSSAFLATTECSDEVCNCPKRSPAPNRPSEIPYPPTPENVDKLRAWFVERYASSAFNKCTHQELMEMTGEPMQIFFKDDAIPFAVHTPIRVPVHLEKPTKAGIDKDVRLGILEEVPQNTPVSWCARMVTQMKKNGSVRRVVDLQKMKEMTLRETHYTRTPFDIVSTVPPNTYKTVLDAWNGYHSLPLAEESKDATTFITQWGRYRYRRAPQGFHASGDAYTKRFDVITKDFNRVSRCVDDSLLYDTSIEDAFWHTCDYLKHCSDNGIVFNEEKFIFAKQKCEFAGFELTSDGFRPPTKILEAIKNFPTPKCPTDIRSWFGLINQVNYAFAQAPVMAPFRELLTKRSMKSWYWDDTLSQLFEKSKIEIVQKIKDGVTQFEMNRTTCLSTDWSKSGLGFSLMQKHCRCNIDSPTCGEGHWKLVYAGSRFTKPAEERYAPIEGETLAVAYGLEQCRMFILGCPKLIVAVDHKPLLNILNDRALDTIENPRVLRLKEKTLVYDFKIVYVQGKKNCMPDIMSRLSHSKDTSMRQENDEPDEVEVASKAFAVHTAHALPTALTLKDIDTQATLDEPYVLLKRAIENGFPEKKDGLPTCVRSFWNMREDLFVIGNTVFKGRKILIPFQLRAQVLEGLHAGHQGVSSMKAAARERFFWPGLDGDISQVRAQCRSCNQIAPSQAPERMMMTQEPDLPFEKVVMDPCHIAGNTYLVYADRYSGWTEVALLKSTSFKDVKKELLYWFRSYGVPNEISSDGGPPFNSYEFENFLRTWGIEFRKSSAYYAQSNGRAEVAVKLVKRLLMDNIDNVTGQLDTEAATRALLIHRNTPSQISGMSPSELLFGQKIRDHLPNGFRKLRPEFTEARKSKELRNLRRQTNLKNIDREYCQLEVGQAVSIQNQKGNQPKKWSSTGIVTETLPNRQYHVLIDGSRRLTTRNRKFLRKIPDSCRGLPFADVDPSPVPEVNDFADHGNTPDSIKDISAIPPDTTQSVVEGQNATDNFYRRPVHTSTPRTSRTAQPLSTQPSAIKFDLQPPVSPTQKRESLALSKHESLPVAIKHTEETPGPPEQVTP